MLALQFVIRSIWSWFISTPALCLQIHFVYFYTITIKYLFTWSAWVFSNSAHCSWRLMWELKQWLPGWRSRQEVTIVRDAWLLQAINSCLITALSNDDRRRARSFSRTLKSWSRSCDVVDAALGRHQSVWLLSPAAFLAREESERSVTCSSEIPSLHLHKWAYSLFFCQGKRELSVLKDEWIKKAAREEHLLRDNVKVKWVGILRTRFFKKSKLLMCRAHWNQ